MVLDNNLHIRQMLPRDVEPCVTAHLACFPQSFLSFLGTAFLRTYYEGLVGSGLAIALVCERAGQVIGFVTGFASPREYYAYLLRTRLLQFCLASVRAVLKKPSIINKLVGAVWSPKKNPPGQDRIFLSSIAVLPTYRRLGIARRLGQAFVAEATERGGKVLYIGVKKTDHTVRNFYRTLGFQETKDLPTLEASDSVVMVKHLL